MSNTFCCSIKSILIIIKPQVTGLFCIKYARYKLLHTTYCVALLQHTIKRLGLKIAYFEGLIKSQIQSHQKNEDKKKKSKKK